MVPLNRLPKGNVLDEWYPLLPPSHSKVEVGNIRVRSKFTVRKTSNFLQKCTLLSEKIAQFCYAFETVGIVTDGT